MKIHTSNSESYTWGNNCLGWHLVHQPGLSVIQEVMPPGTEEVRHAHGKAQQFFFVLSGTATFELTGTTCELMPREGIQVLPGQAHQIRNLHTEPLEFLVISQPHAHGDRIKVPQSH